MSHFCVALTKPKSSNSKSAALKNILICWDYSRTYRLCCHRLEKGNIQLKYTTGKHMCANTDQNLDSYVPNLYGGCWLLITEFSSSI